jgi:alpha-aminoadipic semialdehyde synthase
MAVDILPSSLPFDASGHFSSVLVPYLRTLLAEYRGQPPKDEAEEGLRKALRGATVVDQGHLVGHSASDPFGC